MNTLNSIGMIYFNLTWTDEKIDSVYSQLSEIYKGEQKILPEIQAEKKFLEDYKPIRRSKEVLNDYTHSKSAKYIWDIKNVETINKMLKNPKNTDEYNRNLKFHYTKLIENM